MTNKLNKKLYTIPKIYIRVIEIVNLYVSREVLSVFNVKIRCFLRLAYIENLISRENGRFS